MQVSKCPQIWVDDPIWDPEGHFDLRDSHQVRWDFSGFSAVKSADLPSLFVKYEPKDNSDI